MSLYKQSYLLTLGASKLPQGTIVNTFGPAWAVVRLVKAQSYHARVLTIMAGPLWLKVSRPVKTLLKTEALPWAPSLS